MKYIEFENKKYSYRRFLESIDFEDASTLLKLGTINKDLRERNRSYSDIYFLKEFIKTRISNADLTIEEDREATRLILNYLEYPTLELTDCLWDLRSLILRKYNRNFKNAYNVWIGNENAYKVTREILGDSISILKEFFNERIQELNLKGRHKGEAEREFLNIEEEEFFGIIYSSLGLIIDKCNGKQKVRVSLGGIIGDSENNYKRLLNHIKSMLIVKDIIYLTSLIKTVDCTLQILPIMRDGFVDRMLDHEVLEIIQSIPNKSFDDDGDLQFYSLILHSIESIVNGSCTIYKCNLLSLEIYSILLVKLNERDSKLIEGLYKISLSRFVSFKGVEEVKKIVTIDNILLPENKNRYKIRRISNISGLESIIKYIASHSSSDRLLRETLSLFDRSQITEYLPEDYKNLEVQYSQSILNHDPFIVNLFDSNRTRKCQKISKDTLQLITKILKDAIEVRDYYTYCQSDFMGNKILYISSCSPKLFGLFQIVDEMFPSLLIEIISELLNYTTMKSTWDFSSGLVKISKED